MQLDDGGYLVDPSSKFGKYANPDLKSSEELSALSVLVLLGEPGIGKSHVIATDFEQPNSSLESTTILLHDLRAYSSDSLLYQRLFRVPEVEEWRGGTGQLVLLLDSLDEALLRIETVTALLAEELSHWPTQRLKLRIACRTAVWPHEVLEPALEKLWGEENVGVFELAPLRAEDVKLAARARDIDDVKFMDAVRQAEAQAFAAKPLTLEMLLDLFQREQALGNSTIDLFERGCRTLCEEVNPSRRVRSRHGVLTAADRLAIAGRIAAVTMFSNRFAIWTNPDLGDVPEADVKLDTLKGGIEEVNGEAVSVTGGAIWETLDTGLFTSRGQGRMGWAHQAYGEFLAAAYFSSEKVAARTVAKLVLHQAGGLVPQLQQVAAWLAAIRSDIRHEIIKADPKVMIFSDLGAMDDRDRSAITEEFLRTLDERRDFDLDIGLRQRYRKLSHEGLVHQLRPYIRDSSKNVVVRRAAIEIAEACDVRALGHELVVIALNGREETHVRARAVHALGVLGSEATILQLKPLAAGEAGQDPHDELKGNSLALLWPNHMTAAELFATLTPRKRSNLIGSYAMFLEYSLADGLAGEDILVALEWVARVVGREPSKYPSEYNRLEDKILIKALRHITEPMVAEAFARAAFVRLKRGRQIFDIYADEIKYWKDFLNQTDQRRRILFATIALMDDESNAVLLFDLLRGEDVSWLVEKLAVAERQAEPRLHLNAMAKLIGFTFDQSDSTQFELVYEAAQHSSALRRGFAWLLEPIELGSERAASLKKSHEFRNQGTSTCDEAQVTPPPQERIERYLKEIEGGEVAAWWRLNRELTLEPNSRHYGPDWEMDITRMPGWSASDQATRARLLAAAERYLRQFRPIIEPISKIEQWRPNLAGYRAIALLRAEAPDHWAGLSPEIWCTWAPVLLAVPGGNSGKELQVQQEFVGESYRYASMEIVRTAEALIRSHKRRAPSQPIHFLDRLENCWATPELRELLLKELIKRKLTPPQLESILQNLLGQDDEHALRYAIRCFHPKVPAKPEKRERALVAAKAVALFAAGKAWEKIWAAVQHDVEFGKELFLSVAGEFDRHPERLNSFEPESLGDLFIWLETHFSRNEDTGGSGMGARWLGPRDQLAEWRDQILRHLAQRGSPAAIEALRKCERAFPDLSWIRVLIVDAERQMRRNTWIPLTPEEVIRLKRIKGSELVESTEDLMELIFRGLQDYQGWVDQNAARTAVRLWNRQGRKSKQGEYTHRPIDENDFSDHVRDYLEEKLIRHSVMINREVEISRRPGMPIGDRADIQVDAIRKSSYGSEIDRITIPVEAKGCWNRALKTAMRTQLVEDYMVSINATAGVYLVGWFPKSRWDSDDHRRGQMPDWNLEQARAFFDQQAAELSDETNKTVRAFVVDCGF